MRRSVNFSASDGNFLLNWGENGFDAPYHRSLVINALPLQQPNSLLANLPLEILLSIIKEIKDPATFFTLNATCQGLKAMVEEGYKDQSKQFIRKLTAFITTRPIEDENEKVVIDIHAPYTQEWNELRYNTLHLALLTTEKIKKIYITAWDLLLQPVVWENKQDIAILMRGLLKVTPSINQPEKYATLLFTTFPKVLFTKMGLLQLDDCLQIVIKHFLIEEDSPAYQFIAEKFPPHAINLTKMRYIQYAHYPSFMFYAVNHFLELVERDDNSFKGYELPLFILLSTKYDLEKTNKKEQTVLLYALGEEENHWLESDQLYRLVNLLLEYKANYNARDHYGNTPLIYVCEYGEAALLSLLLKCPDIDVNTKNHADKNALQIVLSQRASSQSASLKLEMLLQHPKLNITLTNEQELNPLAYAVEYGTLTVIKALLLHPQMNKAWLKEQAIYEIYAAIESDALEQVQALLTHPHIIHSATHYFAFNYALWRGRESIVKAFLANVNPQEKNDFINQALALVITRCEREEFSLMVQRLIELGADCNLHDVGGMTALMKACRDEQKALVQFLLQQPEIDVNKETAEHDCALHQTVERGSVEMLQILLNDKKCAVNKVDLHSITALEIAVFSGNAEALHLLLNHQDIEVNIINEEGKSMLELAVTSKNKAMVQALFNKVTNPSIRLSAFNCAIEQAQDDIAEIFLTSLDEQEKMIFIAQAFALVVADNQMALAHKLREKYLLSISALKRGREDYETS
jgi:ankyrin repeat protein